MKDAPIIVLDEATASVDPENEQELLKAVRELTRDKTILMIAHRLSTVRDADQIIVLDKGRIVQHGTHTELIKQEGLYRRFVEVREQALGWRNRYTYSWKRNSKRAVWEKPMRESIAMRTGRRCSGLTMPFLKRTICPIRCWRSTWPAASCPR